MNFDEILMESLIAPLSSGNHFRSRILYVADYIRQRTGIVLIHDPPFMVIVEQRGQGISSSFLEALTLPNAELQVESSHLLFRDEI